MELYPALVVNQKYINMLKIDSHSSDKSDYRSRSIQYAICKLNWCSPELTNYLWSLDIMHSFTWFLKDGTLIKDNWLCVCIVMDRYVDKTSKPVLELPINFYDSKWFATQTPEFCQSLHIKKFCVDLSIPLWVTKWIVLHHSILDC